MSRQAWGTDASTGNTSRYETSRFTNVLHSLIIICSVNGSVASRACKRKNCSARHGTSSLRLNPRNDAASRNAAPSKRTCISLTDTVVTILRSLKVELRAHRDDATRVEREQIGVI